MNLENMEIKIFKALGHSIRLKILKQINTQKLCVSEFKKNIKFSQSNLSQHLKILKDTGIVNAEKHGAYMYYSIKNIEILNIIKIIEEITIKNIKK